jgi:dienelactone hydrolase
MSGASAQLQPYKSILPYKRVEFTTYDFTTLRGNLYYAAQGPNRAPIVIFVHGIGLLKEQYLENWFRYFLQAGYHILTYDNRSSDNPTAYQEKTLTGSFKQSILLML